MINKIHTKYIQYMYKTNFLIKFIFLIGFFVFFHCPDDIAKDSDVSFVIGIIRAYF